VCWSGLVYPVVKVGDPADFRVDVRAALPADQRVREESAQRNPDWPFYRFRHAQAEHDAVSHGSMASLQVCFLLPLGEARLAESTWKAWNEGLRPGGSRRVIGHGR